MINIIVLHIYFHKQQKSKGAQFEWPLQVWHKPLGHCADMLCKIY